MNKYMKNKMNLALEETHIINDSTPFAIKEAYKALYTNVRYFNNNGKCKKIVVSSAVSGEGKTTVSVNLALTLAQNLENKRILLIDADMRCSRSGRLLGIDPRVHGLSEYLAGLDSDPHFEYLNEQRLMVLTAGGPNANPTKLIGSERMHLLLQACEEEFDYIIIDTPPVTVVTDALLFSSYVTGYIITTRSEYSNINKLSECVSSLEKVGAEIFGIVISDLRVKKDSTKYSKYSKYGEI